MRLVTSGLRPGSAGRHRGKPASPGRSRAASRKVADSAAPPLYAPPTQRLADALDECARLDRELKVIENSGHAKIGVFARPLGDQQRCKMMATATTHDAEQHLPEDPIAEEPAFIEDDDATSDPFFHRFYDETGRSMYEQLLRSRMRVLALSKMVYSQQSVQYAQAEVELAEEYARMNLWKQAHAHIMAAYHVLKALDAERAEDDAVCRMQSQELGVDPAADVASDRFGRVLAYFYDRQLHAEPPGEVTCDGLLAEVSQWSVDEESSFDAILEPANLELLFGAAPFLHWQQLLLRMERQSAVFHDFLRDVECGVAQSVHLTLQETFSQLDPSRFGVVPLASLIDMLDAQLHADHASNMALTSLCEALRVHDERVQYPSITWSELVHLSRPRVRVVGHSSLLPDPTDPARGLKARLKYFFGRFFLRKGQVDDAVRYLQLAVAEHEQIFGADSSLLVPVYLSMAETLGVRFKQLAVVAQQNALALADKWLTSTDGTRRVRAKALELVAATARQDGKAISKKDAEARARDELLQEYASLSFIRPDATSIDEAVEFCTRAWRVQEQCLGADHVTTARVHAALAQVHAMKKDWDESLRCYEKAVAIYEAACNGPVPASAWLTLEIAKICHQQTTDAARAARLYDDVGDFFHSFALEFAASNATRRESCAQAIAAWRQWLALVSTGRLPSSTFEDKTRVVTKIHDATVDGFGEFAVEAAESGKELARLLVDMGHLRHAERQLRTAWYVLESHFGPNDRRSRKARKELLALSSELKGAALDDDDGHEWLTL